MSVLGSAIPTLEVHNLGIYFFYCASKSSEGGNFWEAQRHAEESAEGQGRFWGKLGVQDLRIRPPSPPNLGGTGFTPPKVGGLGGQNDGICVSPGVNG